MFSIDSVDMGLSATLPRLQYPISDRCSCPPSCQQPINFTRAASLLEPLSSSGPPSLAWFFFFFSEILRLITSAASLSTGITRCWTFSFLIHLSRKPSKVGTFWAESRGSLLLLGVFMTGTSSPTPQPFLSPLTSSLPSPRQPTLPFIVQKGTPGLRSSFCTSFSSDTMCVTISNQKELFNETLLCQVIVCLCS